jgi:hypothetical protein
MSAPTYSDDPERVPRGGSSRPAKIVAAVAVVGALAFGAKAISHSGSSTSASASAPTSQAGPGGATGAQGGPPGLMGTQVTGATLTKLKAVVTAKYPGTVERAVKLGDGSYLVHVIRSGGAEVHVMVSRDFKITGTQQGGPGGGAPPSGRAAPGATPAGSQS